MILLEYVSGQRAALTRSLDTRTVLSQKEEDMKARRGKHSKDEGLLISVAESIGSTLGTIVAKADATQKAITGSSIAHAAEREGRKLVSKSKSLARKTRSTAARNLRSSKLAWATRRGLRSASSSAKRAVRRGGAKARSTARRARTRK
jgi:hypothetical protein